MESEYNECDKCGEQYVFYHKCKKRPIGFIQPANTLAEINKLPLVRLEINVYEAKDLLGRIT